MKNRDHKAFASRLLSASGLAAAAMASVFSGLAFAQQAGSDSKGGKTDLVSQPAVIELFTSQGCSSCPPADRLLEKLAKDGDVIAMSVPVDYWDYIGWKDTLASPDNTARQRAYARVRGDRRVYTPQAVINGVTHAVGSDLAAIHRQIKVSRNKFGALTVSMRCTKKNGKLVADVGDGAKNIPDKAGLWLYRIAKSRKVSIGRGENSGRAVTYVNVVRSIEKVGEWKGKATRIEIPAAKLHAKGSDGWVLLLQAGSAKSPGVILAAAKSD